MNPLSAPMLLDFSRKSIFLLFKILFFSFYSISCVRSVKLPFYSYDQTKLKIRMNFLENQENGIIASSASPSPERERFLTSIKLQIHIPGSENTFLHSLSFPMGTRSLDSVNEFVFPSIPRENGILLQYLGVIREELNSHLPAYSYGDITLNLKEINKEEHVAIIQSQFQHRLKRNIAIGGQYILDPELRSGFTGEVSVYFHPQGKKPKIPLSKIEMFNGWFHFAFPYTQNKRGQPHISFSYSLSQTGGSLFAPLNAKNLIKKLSALSPHSLKWRYPSSSRFPIEILKRGQDQQTSPSESSQDLLKNLRPFFRPYTQYVLSYFTPLFFPSISSLCFPLTGEEIMIQDFSGRECEEEEKVDSLVSRTQPHRLFNYPSRIFGFYGPFEIKNEEDFFQPFLKTQIIEGPNDKIRLFWSFLPGVSSFFSSSNKRIGVSIYAKNTEDTENREGIQSLFSPPKELHKKLLDPYLPDESLEIPCSNLEGFGWEFIGNEEENPYYDFNDRDRLSLKEPEKRQRAKNWKFLLCPYERTFNQKDTDRKFYSSFVRKLCLEGEECEQFHQRNSFGKRKLGERKISVSIEDENILFSHLKIGGAFGRIVSVERIEDTISGMSFFLLEVPSKKGEFKVGDEILLHISLANSKEACGQFQYKPLLQDFWTLSTVLEKQENHLLIEGGTFIDQINTENLNLSLSSPSLCYVQIVKIPVLDDLSIKNGTLSVSSFHPDFGGGIIALRIRNELSLNGAKIHSNFLGPLLKEEVLRGANNLDSLNENTENVENENRENQERIGKEIPRLSFGRSSTENALDLETSNLDDSSTNRGGGLIYLTARKISVSPPFQSIESKGAKRGTSGSIYLTTKSIEPLIEEEGFHVSEGNVDSKLAFLLMNTEGGGGSVYHLNCSLKNFLPYTKEESLFNQSNQFDQKEFLLNQALSIDLIHKEENEIIFNESAISEHASPSSFFFEHLLCP